MSSSSVPKKKRAAAIVLAAGLGRRMKSKRAKVLHRIAGEPMVVRVVRACFDAGLAPVVVVVGHQRELVEAAVRRAFPAGDVQFAWQREQRGTGHAVAIGLTLLRAVRGRVVITSGDTPLQRSALLRRLVELEAVVGFATVRVKDSTGYGRVVRDRARRAIGIIEEKDASPRQRRIREVNTGLYGVDGRWIGRAVKRLCADNAQGEFYLTDVVALAARDGERVETVVVADPLDVAGINTRDELRRIDQIARRRLLAEKEQRVKGCLRARRA